MFKYYFDVHWSDDEKVTEFLVNADNEHEAFTKVLLDIPKTYDIFMIYLSEKS